MRFCVSLLSFAVVFLTACGQKEAVDYGFTINNVSISQGYQSLNLRVQQKLQLSQPAREALEHGVTLSFRLEFELHSDSDIIVVYEHDRLFRLRYLPLSEHYQLETDDQDEMRSFSRLRHLLAAIDDLRVKLSTGPLLPGDYEIRTRVSLDESRLPTPMQLPAWFSAEWRHDSEWSVWPFKISA